MAGDSLSMIADFVLPMSVTKRGRGTAVAHASTNSEMLRTGVHTAARSAPAAAPAGLDAISVTTPMRRASASATGSES